MTTYAITFSKKPTRNAAPFRVTLQSTMRIEERLGSLKQTTYTHKKTKAIAHTQPEEKTSPNPTFQPILNHFEPF